jgi:hypothetical protein
VDPLTAAGWLTTDRSQRFARDGFLRIPQVVGQAQVAAAAGMARRAWTARGSPAGWTSIRPDPQDASALEGLLLGGGTAQRIAEFLPARYRVSAQLTVTAGRNAPPRGPHLDGPLDGHGSGVPAVFSLLVGVLLTDQGDADVGNLWVWPGSHLRAADYYRVHGPGALTATRRFPDVPLEGCAPVQIRGSAGDAVVVSYLLGHAAGGSTAGTWRATAYFRLRTHGLASRWQQSILDPYIEFSPLIARTAASIHTR